MAISRSVRRTNPLTLLLAALVAIGFIVFIFSGSSTPITAATIRGANQHDPVSHELSPATAPRSKQAVKGGKRTPPPVVHYHMNNVTTSADPLAHEETVLLLTPMARFYPAYWENLLALSYPHKFISLGFIIPKTKEGDATYAALSKYVEKTQLGEEKQRFASVTILRQDFEPGVMVQDESERHKLENQRPRRAAMARARNSLLYTLLGPYFSWVLWIDADIIETPHTLFTDLAKHHVPIITPNCMQRYTDENGKKAVRPYDYNSWQDSEKAQELGKKMGIDDLLLEGYAELATYRTLMAKVAEFEPTADKMKMVALDGVGGTVLLVKAEVHRDGAMFPPFVFYHLIETEGFAKMAKRLSYQSYGLPNYFVYHHNE